MKRMVFDAAEDQLHDFPMDIPLSGGVDLSYPMGWGDPYVEAAAFEDFVPSSNIKQPRTKHTSVLVYADSSSKRIKNLVKEYMSMLVDIYRMKKPTHVLSWKFATSRDVAAKNDSVCIFFYTPSFIKSQFGVKRLCSCSSRSAFIVLDPRISQDPEAFVVNSQECMASKGDVATLRTIHKIAGRLRDGLLYHATKFRSPTNAAFYSENSTKLAEIMDAILYPVVKGHQNSGFEELLIDYPKQEENLGQEDFSILPAQRTHDYLLDLGVGAMPHTDDNSQSFKRRKVDYDEESILDANSIPKRQFREKGQVYVVNDVRKKWDGRQWRRLCQYQNCDHAARGSITFCVSHYKLTKSPTAVPEKKESKSTDATRIKTSQRL